MKKFTWIMALLVLLASFAIIGCVSSPSPTPTPAPTAASTVTAIPSPSLIGGDEAHIVFNYNLGSASSYSGLQNAAPGYLLYTLQVKVTSDKPVPTSQDWFWLEYKVNDTDSIHTTNNSMSYQTYPSEILGPNSAPAKGQLIFELPAKMAPGYPKAYYYMAKENQPGPYYVYDKVYGTVGNAG